MKAVKLGLHYSGLLYVNASVVLNRHGREKVCRPFAFIVDTASERTHISHFYEKVMEQNFGPRENPQIVLAKCLRGDLEYSSSRGYMLKFPCIGTENQEMQVAAQNYELCFAPGLAAQAPVLDRDSKPIAVNHFNILGRDILRNINLFVPRGMERGGILVDGDPLSLPQSWAEMFQKMEHRADDPPETEIEDPKKIDWRG